MLKRVVAKNKILLILSLSLIMVFCFSPFISLAESLELSSSPVPDSDLSNNFESKPESLTVNPTGINLFHSGTTATGAIWNYSNISFGARNGLDFLAYYSNLTLQDGYRYIISVDVLAEFTLSSGSVLSFGSPSFVLYSFNSNSELQVSSPVSPSSFEITDEGYVRYIFDFTFDVASLFGSSHETNNGSYSISGYGFSWSFGSLTRDVSSAVLTLRNRQCLVYSPEDWQTYQMLNGLYDMGPDSSYVQDDVNQSKQETDELLGDLDSMDKPDAGEAAADANPFDIVSEDDFGSFVGLFTVLVNNQLITGMIVLVAIFGMISYVFFGKR